MDRLEFAHNITYADFEKEIILYFDQIMAMYDIVCRYENINVNTNTDSDISFDIILNNDKDISNLLFDLSVMREIHRYDKAYQIEHSQNENIISIYLRRIR